MDPGFTLRVIRDDGGSFPGGMTVIPGGMTVVLFRAG